MNVFFKLPDFLDTLKNCFENKSHFLFTNFGQNLYLCALFVDIMNLQIYYYHHSNHLILSMNYFVC